MLIAALQMYDWPEVQSRADAYWAVVRDLIRAEGIAAPVALARPADISTPWTDAALVLGQTCGLPYVSGKCGDALVLARPTYAVEGCAEGTYSSAIIAQREGPSDLAAFVGAKAAVNGRGSQSGCNALVDCFQENGLAGHGPIFSSAIITGAHRNSANLVARNEADIAAIDAVAWALHAAYDPGAHGRLKVVAWTRPMPTLPFITGARMRPHADTLRRALAEASATIQGPEVPVGLLDAIDADYDPIRRMAASVMDCALI